MSWDRWAASRGLKPIREADTMLAVPRVEQANGHDCGPACVSAVLRFLGYDIEPPDVHGYLGMSPDYMETCLRRADRDAVRVLAGEMDVADLRYHVSRGRPVVCLINVGGVGHYVVCRGVTSRGRVGVMDPAGGPASYAKTAFLAAWEDASRMATPYHRYGLAVWRGPA